jgi:hypothetical protein
MDGGVMDGETIHAFQARAAARLAEHDRKLLAPVERELARARRALAVSRATLTMERGRARDAIAELERIERESSSRSLSSRYTAIVALLGARRILGL